MKTKIINESILMIRDSGLKFSVEDLTKRLKISKKTIYKLFPSKEILAMEIYEYYYENLNKKFNEFTYIDKEILMELNKMYFSSSKMIDDSIFNKFNLNETIREYAMNKHNEIWESIKKLLIKINKEEKNIDNYKIIIDGICYKVGCLKQEFNDDLNEMLVNILWI